MPHPDYITSNSVWCLTCSYPRWDPNTGNQPTNGKVQAEYDTYQKKLEQCKKEFGREFCPSRQHELVTKSDNCKIKSTFLEVLKYNNNIDNNKKKNI